MMMHHHYIDRMSEIFINLVPVQVYVPLDSGLSLKSEKLYLEGGAMWVNKVELLRQYGAMGLIFPKSQAT